MWKNKWIKRLLYMLSKNRLTNREDVLIEIFDTCYFKKAIKNINNQNTVINQYKSISGHYCAYNIDYKVLTEVHNQFFYGEQYVRHPIISGSYFLALGRNENNRTIYNTILSRKTNK